VSPARKREIEHVISASGARFVEVAVMAPVLPYGHRVPMLLGGHFGPEGPATYRAVLDVIAGKW
jgi:hypothetical protein